MLDVTVRHRFEALQIDVAFTAGRGVTALFGPSGAGKTSVVNSIAGLLRADHAVIRLGDRVLADSVRGQWEPVHRRRIGYVFQDARLFPHLTVRQNLLYGRWFARRRAAPAAVIDMLGLGALLHRSPAHLSGGEKQRVAIGRALLASPELLLMDEPLASLDSARKQEIVPYLERLCREGGVPVLYVSHAVEEVRRLAATVLFIEDGRVVKTGTAADL
jgi:molybdate transport system ATP-binding protein